MVSNNYVKSWQTVNLRDLCNIKYGKDHKKLEDGIYPVYGSGGIMRSVNRFISDNPSVLIPRKGTLTNLFYVDKPFWTVDTLFWTEIFTDKVESKFLFYRLLTENLASYNVGTAVPSLTTAILNDLEINLPPLEEQKAIAGVLSAFDDKIEINNQINKNLEEQAKSIFKQWFVDFEDGLYSIKVGELPLLITDFVSNGSFASLKENVNLYQEQNHAYFIRNTDLKAKKFGVYVDIQSYEFLKKSKLSGGEIIISNVGDVGSVYLCPKLDKPMTLGNNIIVLKDMEEQYKYYLYILFKWSYGKFLIQGITGGSAQPKFNKTDFKSMEIKLPDQAKLINFHNIIKPILVKIQQNEHENAQLAKMRDELLPKLMSGEIRLPLED